MHGKWRIVVDIEGHLAGGRAAIRVGHLDVDRQEEVVFEIATLTMQRVLHRPQKGHGEVAGVDVVHHQGEHLGVAGIEARRALVDIAGQRMGRRVIGGDDRIPGEIGEAGAVGAADIGREQHVALAVQAEVVVQLAMPDRLVRIDRGLFTRIGIVVASAAKGIAAGQPILVHMDDGLNVDFRQVGVRDRHDQLRRHQVAILVGDLVGEFLGDRILGIVDIDRRRVDHVAVDDRQRAAMATDAAQQLETRRIEAVRATLVVREQHVRDAAEVLFAAVLGNADTGIVECHRAVVIDRDLDRAWGRITVAIGDLHADIDEEVVLPGGLDPVLIPAVVVAGMLDRRLQFEVELAGRRIHRHGEDQITRLGIAPLDMAGIDDFEDDRIAGQGRQAGAGAIDDVKGIGIGRGLAVGAEVADDGAGEFRAQGSEIVTGASFDPTRKRRILVHRAIALGVRPVDDGWRARAVIKEGDRAADLRRGCRLVAVEISDRRRQGDEIRRQNTLGIVGVAGVGVNHRGPLVQGDFAGILVDTHDKDDVAARGIDCVSAFAADNFAAFRKQVDAMSRFGFDEAAIHAARCADPQDIVADAAGAVGTVACSEEAGEIGRRVRRQIGLVDHQRVHIRRRRFGARPVVQNDEALAAGRLVAIVVGDRRRQFELEGVVGAGLRPIHAFVGVIEGCAEGRVPVARQVVDGDDEDRAAVRRAGQDRLAELMALADRDQVSAGFELVGPDRAVFGIGDFQLQRQGRLQLQLVAAFFAGQDAVRGTVGAILEVEAAIKGTALTADVAFGDGRHDDQRGIRRKAGLPALGEVEPVVVQARVFRVVQRIGIVVMQLQNQFAGRGQRIVDVVEKIDVLGAVADNVEPAGIQRLAAESAAGGAGIHVGEVAEFLAIQQQLVVVVVELARGIVAVEQGDPDRHFGDAAAQLLENLGGEAALLADRARIAQELDRRAEVEESLEQRACGELNHDVLAVDADDVEHDAAGVGDAVAREIETGG